ncbi:hypothetical protein [Stenotrophomonas terrae]|uniref:hypothetical protein n=1 Tax=Stenotrophomonas terrae TaxID=405446 RepID=UPI00070D4C98|nr:hypothetical protein [Stenotrophomonas terrae]
MSFSAGSPVIWPRPPDWGSSVRETLAWYTEVLQASGNGTTLHRALRLWPRRSFAFDVLADEQERRILDALMRAHGSGRWLLPIYPDEQLLRTALAAGATAIPCSTEGYDFVAGGRAVLWAGINEWEVLDIDSVGSTSLALSAPVARAWSRGARLLPLRWARMDASSRIKMVTDTLDRLSVSFTLDETSEWPAQLADAIYRGHPVLTFRPDFAEDLDVGYSRIQETTDNLTALPFTSDLPDVAFRTVRTVWERWGRKEQSEFRSMLYALLGRAMPIWVPTWQQDLRLKQSVTAAATTITVEWCGYTLYSRRLQNRQDVAITLTDGTTLYRRITDATEVASGERLTLDNALGRSVSPVQVRSISFLGFYTQASDTVEIEHITAGEGGRARIPLAWQEVVPDAA